MIKRTTSTTVLIFRYNQNQWKSSHINYTINLHNLGLLLQMLAYKTSIKRNMIGSGPLTRMLMRGEQTQSKEP